MLNLLGRKLELLAIPPSNLLNRYKADWRPMLSLDGIFNLDGMTKSPIIIEAINNYGAPKSYTGTLLDLSEVIVFRISLSKDVIAHYTERARRILSEKDAQRRSIDRQDVSSQRRIRSIIFSGDLVRDFQETALTILYSAHIAIPSQIRISRIASIGISGGFTSEKFLMNALNSEGSLKIVSVNKLDVETVYRFIQGSKNKKFQRSQFVKGLSYISQIFRDDSPMVAFMWSIAAIEAMLSTSSDKANSGVLESRLRAVLGNDCNDEMVGRFRSTYRYRNAILHGNVLLPLSYDNRNMFGFSDIEHSETLPYDTAAFAYALALKIMQRFVELRRYDFRYTTSLIAE